MKGKTYLNTVCPVTDCGKTIGGGDVIHQEKGLGFVEDLFGDTVKPLKREKHDIKGDLLILPF